MHAYTGTPNSEKQNGSKGTVQFDRWDGLEYIEGLWSAEVITLQDVGPTGKTLLVRRRRYCHCCIAYIRYEAYTYTCAARAACYFHADLSVFMSETCFGYNCARDLRATS